MRIKFPMPFDPPKPHILTRHQTTHAQSFFQQLKSLVFVELHMTKFDIHVVRTVFRGRFGRKILASDVGCHRQFPIPRLRITPVLVRRSQETSIERVDSLLGCRARRGDAMNCRTCHYQPASCAFAQDHDRPSKVERCSTQRLDDRLRERFEPLVFDDWANLIPR